jgi:hypothetical protein
MKRHIILGAIAIVLCYCASLADAQQRRSGSEPPGRSSTERKPEGTGSKQEPKGERTGKTQEPAGSTAPGGEWSARTHSGKVSGTPSAAQQTAPGTGTAAASAADKTRATQPTNAQGVTAATAINRNQTPQATGAQGAAAATAVNRNQTPPLTGAQGAAAGAAAASRNAPPVSDATAAAAGAAAANRNSPQMTGAQGAALGAAAANNNQSAQAAAVGAAAANAANNNQPQFSATPSTTAAAGASPLQPAGAQTATDPSAATGPSGVASGAPADATATAAAGYEAVRNSFNASNVYRPQWWRDHPTTWVPPGWVPGTAWRPATWEGIARFCGYGNAAPISYNYGVNVTAQNGNVFVNGTSVGSTADFSSQAARIAQQGATAAVSAADQWLPLGVFAMVRDERQHPQLIVQLALDKQGVLRGNYVDELTENTQPIRGGVDSATKRAAWLVGDNQQTVMETGLADLTDPETPALIHKNGKTDHWILVRLDQPK